MDVTDTRDCSVCDCDTGTGSCTDTFRVYGSLNICMGAPAATIPNDGACHNADNEFASSVEAIATIDDASGSCPVLGGEPIGDVVASGPFTTDCCTH